jgi:Cu-Zn family superoxide dismutase
MMISRPTLLAFSVAVGALQMSDMGFAEQTVEQSDPAASQSSATEAGELSWLGVRLAPARSSIERGVLVTQVFSGSPADLAGLKKGDMILRIDKVRVEAASDLQMAVDTRPPGQVVNLVVRRGGDRITRTVRLESFNHWREGIERLDEGKLRELIREVVTAPIAVLEEALPDRHERQESLRQNTDVPSACVVVLHPTKESEGNVQGVIELTQENDGLHVTGQVNGLNPGTHGFHIHEYGDARGPAGKTAGGHFNPWENQHGGPNDEEHHAGDLGNIRADESGVAHVDITAPWLKLHYVVGRSIVVHAGEDDFRSQPSGDAGGRVAIGVIGIAKSEM